MSYFPTFAMEDTRLHFLPPVWLPIVVALLLGGSYIAGKNIEAKNAPGQQANITVSGDGRAFAVPDIAQLQLGVQTGRLPTAAAAMESLKEDMDDVIAAIKEQGIAEKDIRTQSFNLRPVYDYNEGRQIPRGYEANQNLQIKVRDLDKVSDVLGAATNAGANQSGGVQFTVDEPESKREEARAEAIAEAQEKARVLADQLGVSLGRVMNFSEHGGGRPPQPMHMDSAVMGRGGMEEMQEKAVQLPAGEHELTVQVSITYELK